MTGCERVLKRDGGDSLCGSIRIGRTAYRLGGEGGRAIFLQNRASDVDNFVIATSAPLLLCPRIVQILFCFHLLGELGDEHVSKCLPCSRNGPRIRIR